jgi:hypothetical protein
MDTWRSQIAKSGPQLERLEQENYALRYGETGDSQQAVESVRQLRARLARTTLDMGRVWRNCTPSPPQPDGTVVVNTVPARRPSATPDEPAAADAAAAAPAVPAVSPIQDQTVLYVFLEQTAPAETNVPDGEVVPYYYIGDFVAVASTNTSVSLRPLTPLGNFDRQVLTMQRATWALYETMPVDGHEWFTQNPEAIPNWNQPASEVPVFGEIDEQAIRAVFEWRRFEPQTFAPHPEVFKRATDLVNESLAKYLRDGKPVANKDEFDTMNVWTKVRFLKSHKEIVDSGATVSPFTPGVTDDFFDRGMAEVAILQLGAEAQFNENDVAIFPQDEAQRLIDAGVCKFEEYVYVRNLRDYGFLFRDFDQQFDRVGDDIEYAQRDVSELESARQHIDQQLALANDEQSKLQHDLQFTREEASKIAAYVATLEKTWNETRARLSQLFARSLELSEELERRSQAVTQEIRRRGETAIAER